MWFTQHCSPSLQWEQERPVTSPPTCLLRPRWWLHWALWVSSSGSRSFSLTSLCQRRGSFVCLWGLADKVIARVCVCVFQCSSVLPPVGGGVERGGEARLFSVRAGKHLVGNPRPTGTGSDITTGHDQQAAGTGWEAIHPVTVNFLWWPIY